LTPVTAPTPAPGPRVLRFDKFELDVRAGELRKRGVKLRLQGQPLQVLAVLLSRRGDVVTREEFRTQIWAADTFIDFEHSLHNAIARLRDVLGDSAEKPRYIETLPRRGYRFIGQVDGTEVQSLFPVVAQNAPPAELLVSPTHTKSRKFLVTAILTPLLIGFTVWLVRANSRATGAASRLNSIAVLPLANLSGDPSEEFFADGMTDQLITDLAKVSSLRVISRTSVMPYKGTKKRLPEIARDLNVSAIVEGSVVRSDQRVRVTAQLVKASTDQHLWAETYDRDLGDVLKLQGEVAGDIAQQVRAQLTPQEQAKLHRTYAVNPAAYDTYLKGHFYFSTEFTKPDSLRKAQHLFEEATQKDPNFALAYADLGYTYMFLAYAGALQKEPAYQAAKKELAKAMTLDDGIAETYDALGALNFHFDWNWDGAERAFDRAIALAPSYTCALEDRVGFLAFMGRRAEALAGLARVQQLDSSFGSTWAESITYYQLRDYPRLIEASRRALLFEPDYWPLHDNLGVGYEATGNLQEAISEYQKASEMSHGDPGPAVALAHVYSAAGRKADAEQILRGLERKSKGTSTSPYTMATIYAGLGENDKAFKFLEKAYAEKSFEMSTDLKSDLLLDNLRPDPRFQSILRRMRLN
jgi:TolB-like protein/DNA-binding winged helix-turn-helix (wHTH) protein/Tfp pilus assembly protein PilF